MNDVAVLIPHYNNKEGLIKSLLSINAAENVDIIIVDDGSYKKTEIFDEELIQNSFLANGEIFLLYLDKNKGIENALNEGLKFILNKKQYSFIARLDCGDLCLENRFETQKTFLTNNTDINLVGTNAIFTNHKGDYLYKKIMPEKQQEIEKKMYLNNMFIHPSVMFTTDVIRKIGFYSTNRKSAEDYAFFFKIVKNFNTANIQEFLLVYEINPNGISILNRKQQVWNRILIIKDNFYFGLYPIYGLFRNLILLIVPNKIILRIKKTIR